MDISLLRDCILFNGRTDKTLMTLEFSPVAVQLDMYGVSLGEDSVIGCILRSGARLLSLLTPHRLVDIKLTTMEPEEGDDCNTLKKELLRTHSLLLRGFNVTIYQQIDIPLAMLLLWRFGCARGFLDVYTALKRVSPSSAVTLEQAMSIPLDYAWYRKNLYIPPSELLVVRKSILEK